ncbi:hypothetical protein GTA08_BOTSDO08440 [Botryosphaeria dothidea]|uniref:Uncharacterized protein n=1 Tax=Botryosphaeria dothidea TaxID=55169 RepID=A0A8H4N0D3_9PEZI|nr:hypothetical protein GTA08_BOTSDO08440 [Botryosphaeria dothidea]
MRPPAGAKPAYQSTSWRPSSPGQQERVIVTNSTFLYIILPSLVVRRHSYDILTNDPTAVLTRAGGVLPPERRGGQRPHSVGFAPSMAQQMLPVLKGCHFGNLFLSNNRAANAMRQSTAPASALFSWWRMEMGGDCLHPPEQRGSLEGKEEELLPSSRTVVVGGLRPEPDAIALNPGSLDNGIVGQIFHQQLLHGEIVQLLPPDTTRILMLWLFGASGKPEASKPAPVCGTGKTRDICRQYFWGTEEAGGIAGHLARMELVSQDGAHTPGQIRAVVRRAIIHAHTTENSTRLGMDDSTTYQNDNEFQHRENMARVRYSQCIKNEEPCVKFIFYYRSEDVLK